jgi:hypothetical protein
LFTEFKYLQDVLEIGGHILPFFVNEQKHNFPVCTTTTTHHMSVPSTMTLNTLLQQLCDREFCLKAPSVTSSVKTLYMRSRGIGKGDKSEFGRTIERVDIKWGGAGCDGPCVS